MKKKVQTNDRANKNDQEQDELNLPHERDQMTTDQAVGPRPVIRQAYDDLQHGLVDTDMRGERGVEDVVKNDVKVVNEKKRRANKIK